MQLLNTVKRPRGSAWQDEIAAFSQVAIPLASAQLAQSATGFADTIMMGRMGGDVLAAGGLAAIVFVSIMVVAGGFVTGVSPLVAEAFGAGKTAQVQQLSRQGLWLALLVALPAQMLVRQLTPILLALGQDETTVGLAGDYFQVMQWGLLPAVGFAALRSAVSALSEARPVMNIMVVGTALNIVGNYVLGFGKLGLPRLALTGLAISSTVTLWGMFIALALYVQYHPRLKPYHLLGQLHRFQRRPLWALIRIGVPIGLFSALETGFFTLITVWMGTLGTAVLAGHQIVFQTIVVVFMVPLGFSYATTVRVGQWLGKENLAGVHRATVVSLVMTGLFTGVASVLFLGFPQAVVGLYLDVDNPANATIVAAALPLLKVGALVQILDGSQKAIYGALQGLQDTQMPMLLNILGFWGVGSLASYSLSARWGSVGLWGGQSIAIGAVAMLFFWRYRQRMAQMSARDSVKGYAGRSCPS